MSKEKQIEEMVKIIDQAKHDMWVGECPTYAEHSKNIAKYLYTAGYCKQSEVIKEFVEKIYVEFRMYGVNEKFNKAKLLTLVDKIANEMNGE